MMTVGVTGRVFIHPGSINFDVGKFESGWMVYTEIVETSKLYVRESSAVPIYALLLFGGETAKIPAHDCCGNVDVSSDVLASS